MTGRSKTGSQSKYRIVAIATITVFPLMLPAHADDGKINAEIKQAAVTVTANPTGGRLDSLDINAYGDRFAAVKKAIKRAAALPSWEWECPEEKAGPS